MKRTPLKSDPAKVAAFVQRGRENGLRRATAPGDFRDDDGRIIQPPPSRGPAPTRSRDKPRRKARIPPGMREAVKQRSYGACVACLHREGITWDPLESTCRHASLSIL